MEDHPTSPAPVPKNTGSAALDASIVVCTFRRPALLEACLNSLLAQANPYGAAEVIVVDNCAAAGAEPVVRRLAPVLAQRGLPLRHVVEERNGVAHARNRGLAEAAYPIVCFIDDDEQALPGWLAALLRPFHERGEAVDIVAGEVEPDFGGRPRPDWLVDSLLPAFSCKLGWDVAPRFLALHEWFGEGNCAFRKALLEGSSFNTALGRREGALLSSEGILFTDLRKKGASAFFAPDARVSHLIHPERLDKRWLLQRMFFQGMSDFVAHRSIGHQHQPESFRFNTRDFTGLNIEAMGARELQILVSAYYNAGYSLASNMC